MAYEWIRRKLEVKRLARTLEGHDEIELIKSYYYYIHVKFNFTGLDEFWAINDDGMEKRHVYRFRLPRGPFFTDDLITKSQFETNPLYPDEMAILKNHFIIERKQLDEAGWCTLRLKLHKLTSNLFEEGFVPLHYTKSILENDLADVLSDNLDRYKLSPIRFCMRTKQKIYGRRIISHFELPNKKTLETWGSMRHLLSAVTHVSQSKKPLTRENVVRHASGYGFRNPNFYRSWFTTRLNLKGKTVLDLKPTGSRALAVMLSGGVYSSEKYSEMARFVGADQPGERDRYDVAFLNGVYPCEDPHELIGTHSSVADVLVVCTSKEHMSDMICTYSPKYTLRISVRPPYSAVADDYIFIIDQR